MIAQRISKGDTIGIVSPSHVASIERYEHIITIIESKGFRVKVGENFYKNTYGYSATETERADDFNNMIFDEDVKMVFFGGGNGGNELLPYIDYEGIKKHPKIFCSYSDGTTILNAIYAKTMLITYYGQAPGTFEDLRYYDYIQFSSHFLDGNVKAFVSNSRWKSIHNGLCEGILIGGYTRNFALLVDSKYFEYDDKKKYVLFLEDHEKFSSLAEISSYLSHIEQSQFMNHIAGLLFGHGVNHAILPIGCTATLDTDKGIMNFSYRA
ncbi:MAG: LD-carboxypeptidase [Gorillibacterium sp.]|nr:LD-carboxypeptidase [Gorillibacterium sp.]